MIASNQAIMWLCIEHFSLCNPDAEMLGKALASNRSLKEVHLHYCRDGDSDGFEKFLDGVKSNCTLETLEVANPYQNPSPFPSLWAAGDDMRALRDVLKTHQSIRTLGLCNNRVDADGCRHLAQLVQNTQTLKEVELSINPLLQVRDREDVQGFHQLMEAVQFNQSITSLSLDSCELGDEVCAYLAAVLRANSTLQLLNISDNHIGPAGCGLLADSLAVNSSLTSLDISDNSIETTGANMLAACLQHNQGLTELKLPSNLQDIQADINRKLLENIKAKNERELQLEQSEKAVKMFCDATHDPSLITLSLIVDMLPLTHSIHEFRLPFTLACAMQREDPSSKELAALGSHISTTLERLIDSSAISSDPKKRSHFVSIVKCAVESSLKHHFITAQRKHFLNSMLDNKKVFSDIRFVTLERQVESLTRRIEAAERNIETVSQNVQMLRAAMKKKQKRQIGLSIARAAFSIVMASGLVDLLSHVFDMGDVISFGATICHCQPSEWIQMAEQGYDAVKPHIGTAVEVALKKMGYDPDEMINIWTQSTVIISHADTDHVVSESANQLATLSLASSVASPTSKASITQVQNQSDEAKLVQLVISKSIPEVVLIRTSKIPDSSLPSVALLSSLSPREVFDMAESRASASALRRCETKSDAIDCIMAASRKTLDKCNIAELNGILTLLDGSKEIVLDRAALIKAVLRRLNDMPANYSYHVKWNSGSFDLEWSRAMKLMTFLQQNGLVFHQDDDETFRFSASSKPINLPF